MSGEITVTPGKTWNPPDTIDYAGLNLTAVPVCRTNASSIGQREMVLSDFQGIMVSSNYVQGAFNDLQITTGSTTATSATAAFTQADVGRRIVANGVPPGATIQQVIDALTINLSQAAAVLYKDGVTAGTLLTSASAAFTPSYNGRLDIGAAIPPGTTLTYISATQCTMSLAGTDGTNVSFQINGRVYPNTPFSIIGRGQGFKFDFVNQRFELYTGFISGTVNIGSFQINPDGSVTIGGLTIKADGTITYGTSGFDLAGTFFAGGNYPQTARVRIAPNGDITIQDLASANDSAPTALINPLVKPVVMSPAGGGIVAPATVTLACPTRFARMYYRSVQKDGQSASNNTWTSATGNFTILDVGKLIVGTNIPAATRIIGITSATAVTLSANTTATATGLEWYIVPDITDTLYDDITPTPITLNATMKIAAVAFKNGEYARDPVTRALLVTVNLFDTGLGATTCPLPTFSPAPASYGSGQAIVISAALAGSTIFYTTDGTVPAHDVNFNPTGTSIAIPPTSGGVAPTGTIQPPQGTTKLQALTAKSGLSDSPVTVGTYVIAAQTSGGKTATPIFNPDGYSAMGAGPILVTISAVGADYIRYTLDGTTPMNLVGTLINGASGQATIPTQRKTLLQAVAFGPSQGLTKSLTKAATYDFRLASQGFGT